MSRNKEREEQEAREWATGLYLIAKLLTDPAWVQGLKNDMEDIAELYTDCIRTLEGKPPRYHSKRESVIQMLQERQEQP